MTSKSKKAQEQLAELEKLSAPFEDQLVEAAKFVSVDLDTILQHEDEQGANLGSAREGSYFGREEWLLRWLLKKLQAPTDPAPRKTAASWSLLLYLLKTIPVTNGAKILVERGFVSILSLGLEELVKDSKEPSAKPTKKEKTSSKKRKRTGEIIDNLSSSTGLPRLLECVCSAVNYITKGSSAVSGGSGTAFLAEYMHTVFRTSSEGAAKILGSWMSLCDAALQQLRGFSKENWLSPFISIWSSHTVDTTAYLHFSLHCTRPILALLRKSKSSSYPNLGWTSQLEQLIAREIMNPAKASMLNDPQSELLSSLVTTSVLQDLSNAPILFEVAIRSIKPHGSRRRRASDDAWLLYVFKTLKGSIPPKASRDGKAISAMLRLAIDYKVTLDLPIARVITSEFAFPENGDVSWELVATMLKLDANVFLIPDQENETGLLDSLLSSITKASLTKEWLDISDKVVSEVVVPLMNEFSKARDLTGFIRHWHAELVVFDRLRAESEEDFGPFSAWEDDALQVELRKVFEASLTLQQIEQILEWLSSEVTATPNAVCVVLDAIAGSIVGEAVIDAVSLRLYHIMFDDGASKSLHERYKWRCFRIVSQTIDRTTYANIDTLLTLWQRYLQPFYNPPEIPVFEDFVKAENFPRGATSKLDFVEKTRLACSIWSAPESGKLKESQIKPVVLELLKTIASLVGTMVTFFKQGDLQSEEKGNDTLSTESNKVEKTYRWLIWSVVRCIFVEYPKTLQLGLEMEGEEFKEFLQGVFWLCSSSLSDEIQPSWLKTNQEAFPSLWLSALSHDDVLNSRKLTDFMIDTTLNNLTHHHNPILPDSTAVNHFAVKSLLGLRMETLNKKQREAILKGWVPTGDTREDERQGLSYSNALDPAILSLKLKITDYAMFYDGMEFDEFIHLAASLTEKDDHSIRTSLPLLKELCRKTFEYVHTIPNEPRNKAYIKSAFKTIQKKLKKATEKSKHRLTYPFISILEVVLKILLDASTSIVKHGELESAVEAFKSLLLIELKGYYDMIENSMPIEAERDQLTILSIVDALSAFSLTPSEVEAVRKDVTVPTSVDSAELDVFARLKTFIFTVTRGKEQVDWLGVEAELTGKVENLSGRKSIIQKSKALTTACKDNKQKLDLLQLIIGTDGEGLRCSDKLLAALQVIISVEDTGKPEEGEENSFDLSEAYSMLSRQLWRTTGVVPFSIISETLQLMLQTKPRSISQFNVDTTLGSISILCSRNGPSLNPSRANTIYIYLCQLLRSILLNHRLKLQGHMHLVVQTMQALLRCLFRPLPHTAPTSKFGSPPPWLSSTSLSPQAAECFTRLVTLLCDPTESSVRGKRQSVLVSASDKWKKVAGWHMQFVLMEYVALQLEMRMDSEVREKLVPGIYAIFDTTSIEQRRAISARLDGSQRAVFGGLVRDYLKFGKWNGA